ncbi:helix-turn-helix transcriptional regulator [Aeromicrobium phragmitis]|uniref:Helix-turn-helix transcriptional regulator n=1 Tax=Aeromicrobium phragmitis TaxID=2478914 RepID=A0A3L8PJV7_9ACTN|nr:LuxR family transcriptional regulator [Aeromicrobium phragmitis]RLV55686.1 helix-turn-helix transcriptional regulator [Aeromicrobium phragmitis]
MLQRSMLRGDTPGHDVPRLSAAAALPYLSRYLGSGADTTLLVVGASGLGKTHVLEQLARREDAPILRGQEDEQQFDLSGLSSFLGLLHPAMMHELGRHLQVCRDDDAGLYAAAHDLRELIGGLGLPPTLVLIDDIDLFDRQSAAILATLLPRLSGTNVRVVATATTPPRGFGSLRQLHLAEFSGAEAERLAKERFPGADSTTLRLLLEYAGREPATWLRAVGELCEQQRSGATPLALPLTTTGSHPGMPAAEPEQSLLLDVALSPLTHGETLAALHDDADASIAELLDTGTLRAHGPYVYLHDQRLRSAILRQATKRRWRERRAALADAVSEEFSELGAWYRSFLTADTAVAEELFRAAKRAAAEGHLQAAAEMAERAFARWPSTVPHPPAVVDVCWAFQWAGETALATRYGRWALTVRNGAENQLRLAAVQSVGALSTGERLFDAADEALVTLHGARHRNEVKKLEGIVAAAHLERWEPVAAREALDRARSFGRSTGGLGDRLLAELARIADAIEGKPGPSPLPLTTSDCAVEELIVRARLLSLRENHADARRLFEVALHHPSMQDRAWIAFAHYAALLNEIAGGDFHAARRTLDLWSGDAPWISRETATSTWADAWRHYSLGEIEEAVAMADRSIDIASRGGAPAHHARALALRGVVQLMTDDVDAALSDLRAVSVLTRDFPYPGLLRQWGDYVEACVRADCPAEARRAVENFAARMRGRSSRWAALVLSRSRALVAPVPESVRQLTTLVRSLDEGELISYEGARTLRCLSARQDAAGQPAEAHRTATTAATIFDTLGAVGWAAQTRLDSGRLPTRASPPNALEKLSPREQEIARMVQSGLRNREIAERLYLSLRTVELRLTQIYRRLDIASRAQLIALLGEDAA